MGLDLRPYLSWATKHSANHIENLICQSLNLTLPQADEQQVTGIYDKPRNYKDTEVDYESDAMKMMTIIEEDAEKKLKDENLEVKKTQEGCTVTDGHIYQDYDILMNKVDVGHGSWGLYNFYRIQIWKENHKDLFVLFTNWGRIDRWTDGQYQNTPFSTPEQAVDEFSKIFKVKTGNDWAERANFKNKKKKYRLVQAEHATKVIRPPVDFNLETENKPHQPFPVLTFLKDVTNVNMLRNCYKSVADVDTGAIPFGRIKKKAILNAKNILEQLLPLVKERSDLDEKKYEADQQAQEKIIFLELTDVLDKIFKLSSEYYYLFPKKGFEFEKVQPIDSADRISEENKRLSMILEFESAEAMLLGAMLQRESVNPLDYIYSALNCRVEVMDEFSQESHLIMIYMYRSNGAKGKRVEGIYKVERQNHNDGFSERKYNSNQRRLLWHGTNQINLFSILSKGLMINPLHSERTVRNFGDGVYFADMFDKSDGYTDKCNYMLLCDVELGNYVKGNYEKVESYRDKAKQVDGKLDSLWLLGKNTPDENMTVKTKAGFEIPLGPIIKTATKDDDPWRWYTPDYSEYVCFNEANIIVRYIVKIGDGSKQYNEDNFLFKRTGSGKIYKDSSSDSENT